MPSAPQSRDRRIGSAGQSRKSHKRKGSGRGRCEVNLSRRHFLVLMPAAAIAWKAVLAGTPELAENYKMSDHWWAMLIDIPKCIGCGNCVRACSAENDVPEGSF